MGSLEPLEPLDEAGPELDPLDDDLDEPEDEPQDEPQDELQDEPQDEPQDWDDRHRPPPTIPEQPTAGSGHASPLRFSRRGLRVSLGRDDQPAVLGNAALLRGADSENGRSELPEGRQLRRGDEDEDEFESVRPLVDDGRVRPISKLGDPVDPLVLDGFVTEPAYDPVIGPELAAARTRVGLTVDELAERTRIRPHVIESIEVDDFAPCGGDFYARGHLRTLARVLGRNPVPMLQLFDARYATAPINAKRVFEAELATGMTGSMRSTVGGPNWALLIGVVLALVMTWGVVRLFASQPTEVLQPATPVLNGSAGVAGDQSPKPPPAPAPKPVDVTIAGVQDSSQVVVRDRAGKVVWAGAVTVGEKRSLQVTPPVKVQAQNAGALQVTVNGTDRGALGVLGQPATRTFTRLAR